MYDDLSAVEYGEAIQEFGKIEELVGVGILGSKTYDQKRKCWRWPILKPGRLPDWLLESNYIRRKEIHWYRE